MPGRMLADERQSRAILSGIRLKANGLSGIIYT